MKKALIVVDVQNDFCEGGSLAVPDANAIIPIINDLLNNGPYDLLVATQDWHPSNHKSFASNWPDNNLFDLVDLNGIPQVLWPDHCVANTEGANIHEDLVVQNKMVVIFYKGKNPEVDSYSGFYDNDHKSSSGLAEFLKEKGIEEVDVCGLATDYCVKATALDAIKEGFKVNVLLKASRGVFMNEGDEENTIQELKDNGVNVVE